MARGASQSSTTDKVEAYRARMRANGLRPLQMWVPDTRTAQFKNQAHEQSLAVAGSQHAIEDQSFIDAISVFSST